MRRSTLQTLLDPRRSEALAWSRFRALAITTIGLLAPQAGARQVECISIGLGGQPSNGPSGSPSKGASTGRYIAFVSRATNLVASTPPGLIYAAYLRDRATQTTSFESYLPDGTPTSVQNVAASDDGRYVWFSTVQSPPPGSNSLVARVYRRDRVTQATAQLQFAFTDSVYFSNCSADGSVVGAISYGPPAATGFTLGYGGMPPAASLAVVSAVQNWPIFSFQHRELGPLSGNGRYLTYAFDWSDIHGTVAKELVRHDRQTGQRLVLATQPGAYPTAITADGRYVAALQQNAKAIEVYDTQLGTADVVMQSTDPVHGFGAATLSADARFVAFMTALALVPSDVDTKSDIYLLDRTNNQLRRLSEGPAGPLGGNVGVGPPQWLAGTHEVLFAAPDGMTLGDTNGTSDVFAVAICVTSYRDADGDGFGDPAQSSQACPVPAGHSVIAGDCDDTSPTRYPGAPELCNGLDDDCDGQVDDNPTGGTAYCTSAADPIGCVPQLSATGCASASASSGYLLRLDNVRGQRSGLFLYGSAPMSMPYSPGNPSVLCVAPPRQRMTPQFSGGSAGNCSGSFSEDFLTWASAHPGALFSPFTPGQNLYFQAWIREPAYQGSVLLSGGWHTTVTP